MKKLVHTREILIKTSDLGDHSILVEGSLIDHRHQPERNSSEESELVHHMVIRLKVKGPGMLIEEAEAAMAHHPREECPEMLPLIRNLEGLEIAPGYSIKVKRAIGGVKGCAHLTSLVIAMGESAVQGYWAAYETERRRRGLREETIKKFINTCHLWKEDGPIVRGLRERLESQSPSSKASGENRRMKHQEGFFKGVRDTRTYFQSWLPEGDLKAVLFIVHGLAEHSGRYMNVVNHFVSLGYAVHGFDQPGHGKSDGTRVYVERFEDYTDTLKICFDRIQPRRPVFLIGHSMGGLIGATYLLDHQRELTGAVLSGPAVKVPDKITPTMLLMGKMLSALMPRVGLLGLEAEGVSRDPAVVEAYISDPLVYRGKITARLAAEMLKAMRVISTRASEITLPIMILQGSADRLVDPAGARMLYDTVSSTEKEIRIYEGFYHEVLNEPERERVLGDVERWIEAHLDSRKRTS